MSKKAIIITSISAIVILILALIFYFRYYFVFAEGIKSGELNYITYKGYVFKTYEGKLLQSGFMSGKNANGAGLIQSYEFKFSVENEKVAEKLMHCSGRNVELHYKEYKNPIMWRGVSEFVVDSIIAVKEE